MPGTRPYLPRTSAAAATSVVLAAAFVLSGCSSSTSRSTGATTSASSSAAAKASGKGGGFAADSGFCQRAGLAQAAQTKAATSFNVGSAAALQKIEQHGLTELHALTATAPSAIKGDLTVVVAADEKLYSALEAANFNAGKVNPSVLSGLNTPEFTRAARAIGDYLTRACGISISPSA